MILLSPGYLKAVVVALLSVCTIIFFNHYQRYHITGQEILENADFADGSDRWGFSGSGHVLTSENGGVAKLDAPSAGESQSLFQVIHGQYTSQLLRLSCEIKTQNIIGGDHAWKAARVALVSHNKAGEAMYNLPHILANQTGSSDWVHYEKVFAIAPDVAKITVAAQIVNSSGTLWIKAISLRPVALNIAFKQYRLAFLFIWVVIAFWVAAPIVKSGFRSFAHGMVLLLASGIVLGVLMPENVKESLGEAISPSTATSLIPFIPSNFNDTQVFSLAPQLPALNIFKVGHFIMFTFLAIILCGARSYRTSFARLVVYLTLFALVTEVLQLFMAGRTAQLGDILIDCAGIATGLAMVWLARCISPADNPVLSD